jgi:Holliday junction resolvase
MNGRRAIIRKVDDNQKEVVKAFRDLGWSVLDIHIVGKGAPDIICGKHGFNIMVEIKDGKKSPSQRKLNDKEEKFFSEWRGSIVIVENIGDVIEFDRKRSRGAV